MGFIKVDKVSHQETLKYRYWGRLCRGVPNDYGIKFNHIQKYMILGAFDNRGLQTDFSRNLMYLMRLTESFQVSTFYKSSVFVGEIPLNIHGTSKFEIAITKLLNYIYYLIIIIL